MLNFVFLFSAKYIPESTASDRVKRTPPTAITTQTFSKPVAIAAIMAETIVNARKIGRAHV